MAWKILKRLVWVSKLLLPAISIIISRCFKCVTYDRGESTEIKVLAVDHSMDCESDHYYFVLVYGCFMVALFPGEYRGVCNIWLSNSLKCIWRTVPYISHEVLKHSMSTH